MQIGRKSIFINEKRGFLREIINRNIAAIRSLADSCAVDVVFNPEEDASDKGKVVAFVASMYEKNSLEDCDKYMIEGKPVGFIKNDAGGEQQGFWGDTFPTLRSGALPAVAYNVTFCDANGTRKDRPNGGLYVTEANTGKTVTANGPNTEMVIVDPAECVPLDLRNATRDPNKKDEQNRQGVGVGEDGAPMNTITSASVPGVGWQSTVRKLLPVECERLMGFPDNHTRISWKGKPEEECPDAPRYKACGNSMCVNVMAWIGHRIQAVEESLASRDAKLPADATVTCHENATEQVP